MGEKIPKKMKHYLENFPQELVGKRFQSGEDIYTILEILDNVEEKGLWARVSICDLGENGNTQTFKRNLTTTEYLHDKEELIEGVNAKMVNPWCYHSSSI